MKGQESFRNYFFREIKRWTNLNHIIKEDMLE